MGAMRWPSERTRLYLTDRATPTRSVVALPNRTAFAASLRTTGILPHIPADDNPTYASLAARWRRDGHATPLFASALSSYDAVRLAALASGFIGGGDTTGAAGLRDAAVSVADQYWGASGMMTLDALGDLYRAVYDVYKVDGDAGWQIVGLVDARNHTWAP